MTPPTLQQVNPITREARELLAAFTGDYMAFQDKARELGFNPNEISVLWNLKEGEKEV